MHRKYQYLAVRQTAWELMYDRLAQFQRREGHANVPNGHTENGAKLGNWLRHQRRTYKQGYMDNDRERRLEEIGVVLDPYRKAWEENFGLLLQFQRREGHANVPNRHQEDGVKLGYWLINQRKAYENGKLDVDCRKRLEEAGAQWGQGNNNTLMLQLLQLEKAGACWDIYV